MKKIYVCSRYAGETDENVKKAREYCGFVAKICGAIPVAPHIYFTQFLDDEDERERDCGLGLGLHALRHCDEFLLVVIDGIISEGMRAEIAEVSRLGMPGRIITLTRKEFIQRIKKAR